MKKFTNSNIKKTKYAPQNKILNDINNLIEKNFKFNYDDIKIDKDNMITKIYNLVNNNINKEKIKILQDLKNKSKI